MATSSVDYDQNRLNGRICFQISILTLFCPRSNALFHLPPSPPCLSLSAGAGNRTCLFNILLLLTSHDSSHPSLSSLLLASRRLPSYPSLPPSFHTSSSQRKARWEGSRIRENTYYMRIYLALLFRQDCWPAKCETSKSLILYIILPMPLSVASLDGRECLLLGECPVFLSSVALSHSLSLSRAGLFFTHVLLSISYSLSCSLLLSTRLYFLFTVCVQLYCLINLEPRASFPPTHFVT